MSTKDDGGPAFPAQPIRHFEDGTTALTDQGGMTLRDYFAAKAMQTMLFDEIRKDSWAHTGKLAQDAYKVADAMLAERGK